MGSNVLFISVMTPATDSGDLVFHFESSSFSSTSVQPTSNTGFPQTYNPPDLISIDLTVSSIPASATETEIADQIHTQLGAQLVDLELNYTGFLSFSEEVYPATFQLTKTDHIVPVWSQSRFKLTLIDNECGANIVINDRPCLITLSEATDFAAIYSIDLSTFTNQQIVNMVKSSSSFLCSWMRNNIVLTTYAKEYRGTGTDTVKLSPTPIVDFDQPRIRPRGYASDVTVDSDFSSPNWDKASFFINHAKGGITFLGSENLVDNDEPFAILNSVYISYIAGENTVPDVVKQVVMDYAAWKITNGGGIGELRSMKGGSGAFTFGSSKESLEKILLPILSYKKRP